MSSPTLTIAVVSAGGCTCSNAPNMRAAPTPPARTVIIRRGYVAFDLGRRGRRLLGRASPSAFVGLAASPAVAQHHSSDAGCANGGLTDPLWRTNGRSLC